MKSRVQLKAMKKEELVAYGSQAFTVDLDISRKKDELIDDLIALQDKAPAKPSKQPVSEPAVSADTVRVTLTSGPASGIDLAVKAMRFGRPIIRKVHLPLKKPADVPHWAMPTLEATAGITFTKEQ